MASMDWQTCEICDGRAVYVGDHPGDGYDPTVYVAHRECTGDPDYSALKDACDEYITAYMSEEDTDLRAAVDKVRRALHGEDPNAGDGP